MSGGEQRVPPPHVLKNRGVPVRVHALVVDDAGAPMVPYARRFEGDGEDSAPVFEERFIQFHNAALVDMENVHVGWADLDAWEDALAKSPTSALVRTFAIVFGAWVPGLAGPTGDPVPDLRRTGLMLIDGDADTYATAVGAAFMLAQGVSPTSAGEVLRAGVKNAKDVRPLIDAEVQKMLRAEQEQIEAALRAAGAESLDTPTSPSEKPDSLGVPGTTGGPEQDALSTSSGD